MVEKKEKPVNHIKGRLKLSLLCLLSLLGDEKARAILHIERESRKKTQKSPS